MKDLLALVHEYTPMVKIPFYGSDTFSGVAGDTTELLNAIFKLSLTIGAMLAVFMFMWGGIEMITSSDSRSAITRGKTKMVNAITGLLLLLGAVIILNTINPQITSLHIFGSDNEIQKLEAPDSDTVRTSRNNQNHEGSWWNNMYFAGTWCHQDNWVDCQYKSYKECKDDHPDSADKCILSDSTASNLQNSNDSGRLNQLKSEAIQLYCIQNVCYSNVEACTQVGNTRAQCGNPVAKPKDTITDDGPYIIYLQGGTPSQHYADKEVCQIMARRSGGTCR